MLENGRRSFNLPHRAWQRIRAKSSKPFRKNMQYVNSIAVRRVALSGNGKPVADEPSMRRRKIWGWPRFNRDEPCFVPG